MYKKMLLLLVIYALLIGTPMAKETVPIKEISAGPASSHVSAAPTTDPSAVTIGPGLAPQSAIAASLIEADLQPAVWIECFTGRFEEYMIKSGLLPIDYIYVHVYNSGNGTSSSTRGQITFFDVLQNKKERFDFDLDPIDPNEWSPKKYYYGPFIIGKDVGITVGIRFCPKSSCSAEEYRISQITEKGGCSNSS